LKGAVEGVAGVAGGDSDGTDVAAYVDGGRDAGAVVVVAGGVAPVVAPGPDASGVCSVRHADRLSTTARLTARASTLRDFVGIFKPIPQATIIPAPDSAGNGCGALRGVE